MSSSIRPFRRLRIAFACASLAGTAAWAQTPPAEPPATPSPAPTPAPAAEAAPAAEKPATPAATQLERVEVTGGALKDSEARRQSTAAKIIIGREEIDNFGDSTVGELLKRLPGVTMQGAPGRGGNIRMRGLGNGYTQILLDGDRVPPGFSLDSLTPEQIERIEILRAPTAETGARAIAGTINIITREGYRKYINDLRLGLGFENGNLQPGLSWTRNDSAGSLIYNLSLSAYRQKRDSESVVATVDQTLDTGEVTQSLLEQLQSHDQRQGLNLSSRLQWRDEQGDSLVLAPFVVYSRGQSHSSAAFVESFGEPPPYASAVGDGNSTYSQLRLNGQWNRRLADGLRLEVRGGLGQARSDGASLRNQFNTDGSSTQIDDSYDIRDRSLNLNGKLSKLFDSGHSLVSGAEVEGTRRIENRVTLQDGQPLLADYGENFQASTSRFAIYAQDEWNPTEQWSAHAGLRWEGIATQGDAGDGSLSRNVSSVWTPIVHAVWKPDPKSRDQVRLSLTRSYRSPTLQNLIARPSLSVLYPPPGENIPSSPDRMGNPDLLPELASGIDIAFERYLPGGGLLSANVFRRNLSNVIRSVTTLQTVTWAPVPRWVAQPQNIGNAVTQGLELEAKFRLSELVPDAPPFDLRLNASFFQSNVESVPGPDNRLDQQPPATANIGVDYRFRGLPLKVGANLNWNPAYTTRLSESQVVTQGRKLVLDANALWTFNPDLALRLTATNLVPYDYQTGSIYDSDVRETALTTARSYVNWVLRLEMKL